MCVNSMQPETLEAAQRVGFGQQLSATGGSCHVGLLRDRPRLRPPRRGGRLARQRCGVRPGSLRRSSAGSAASSITRRTPLRSKARRSPSLSIKTSALRPPSFCMPVLSAPFTVPGKGTEPSGSASWMTASRSAGSASRRCPCWDRSPACRCCSSAKRWTKCCWRYQPATARSSAPSRSNRLPCSSESPVVTLNFQPGASRIQSGDGYR